MSENFHVTNDADQNETNTEEANVGIGSLFNDVTKQFKDAMSSLGIAEDTASDFVMRTIAPDAPLGENKLFMSLLNSVATDFIAQDKGFLFSPEVETFSKVVKWISSSAITPKELFSNEACLPLEIANLVKKFVLNTGMKLLTENAPLLQQILNFNKK